MISVHRLGWFAGFITVFMQQIDYSLLLKSCLFGRTLPYDYFFHAGRLCITLSPTFSLNYLLNDRSVLSRYGGGGKLPGNEPSPIGVTAPNGRRDTVACGIKVNSTAHRLKC